LTPTRRKNFVGLNLEPSANRSAHKFALPLPLPPKWDKPSGTIVAEEKRGAEVVRQSSTDDKLRALKQYRRARGLCDRCAEKWVFGHKCAPTVQLHAIQELWELLPCTDEEVVHNTDSLSDDGVGTLCAMLLESAVSGVQSPRSMRLWGKLQGQDILILVDLGKLPYFSELCSCYNTCRLRLLMGARFSVLLSYRTKTGLYRVFSLNLIS
jgi:hypothetical protein